MITTLIGSLYFTAVTKSAINMEKPPSPTNATHCRSGYAIWAAIVYGRPGAIDARFPEHENICPRCALICRANQLVFVPESAEMIACDVSRLLSSAATTCGFIGISVRV